MGLSDLYAQMLPFLPGCPTPVALQALRQSFRSFCRDTEIWVETVEQELEEDETEYSILPDDVDAIAIRAHSVKIEDREIDSSRYTLEGEGTLTFSEAPSETGTLTVETVLEPIETNDSPPDWMLSRWGDTIRSGALASLMGQSGKPWNDAVGSRREIDSYIYGTGRAKAWRWTRGRSCELRCVPPDFV